MSTIQFEYDPERLIEEVQKRPGIWNFEDVQYRTKKVRHKLWTEVVHELMNSNVKVTKSEMRELELQLQKKWKSIRDCFQKYVRDPHRTKRPYLYNKQLQFLLKNQSFAQPARTSAAQAQAQANASLSDSDDPDDKKRISFQPRKKMKFIKPSQVSSDENEDDDTFDNQDDYRSPEGDSEDISKVASSTKVMDEFAFANVDNLSKNDSEDPDKLFLLSLLPHLKSIPEEYRLNVKVDMMQVLRNANYHVGEDMKMM